MNLRYRNEHDAHLGMKLLLALAFSLLSYLVAFEEQLCDAVLFKIVCGKRRIVAGEAERSVRNVVRNVKRNLSSNCDSVIILVPDEKLRGAVRRKLQRDLPRQDWTRVGVVTVGQIERFIQRLGGKK